MPADNNNAAKPLLDYADKMYSIGRKILGVPDKPAPSAAKQTAVKPDTSWHDTAVAEANKSFSKAQPETSHVAGQKRLSGKYGSKR